MVVWYADFRADRQFSLNRAATVYRRFVPTEHELHALAEVGRRGRTVPGWGKDLRWGRTEEEQAKDARCNTIFKIAVSLVIAFSPNPVLPARAVASWCLAAEIVTVVKSMFPHGLYKPGGEPILPMMGDDWLGWATNSYYINNFNMTYDQMLEAVFSVMAINY